MSRAAPIFSGNGRVILKVEPTSSISRLSDNCGMKLEHRALAKEQPIAPAIGGDCPREA